MAKKLKRPRDPNQLAKLIVDLATGEASEPPIPAPTPITEARRKGGLKGGKARAKKLSATKRRRIAKKAARARWGRA
jgi:hypothetical protein